ncbi:MAG: MoaD/ThiS family protein, partial [Sedimenticola sp.]
QLQARGGIWQETFGADQTVMMAVNQEMADATIAVADGDEVAFFPPVTGG